MAKLLKLRRGTTSQHSSFTGAEGEVTVNTDKDTLVVHDGSTAGGHELLKPDLSNLPAGTIDNGDIASNAAIAGTKISPNFGAQNVTCQDLTLADQQPRLNFVDNSGSPNNPDYLFQVDGGTFLLHDSTNVADRFSVAANGTLRSHNNHDFSAGIDVTGRITATGNIESNADASEFRCGADGDFRISHSGSANILRSDYPFFFKNMANNVTLANFNVGGSCDLYYNGNPTLKTFTNATHFIGNAYECNLDFKRDNGNRIGFIGITASGRVQLNGADGAGGNYETYFEGNLNGSTKLYYDNDPRISTVSSGIEVNGPEGTNCELFLSADEGDDNSDKWKFVAFATPTGTFGLYNYTDGAWEQALGATGGGSTQLFYNDWKTLETTNDGATVFSSGTNSNANFKITPKGTGVYATLSFTGSNGTQVASIGTHSGADTMYYQVGNHLFHFGSQYRLLFAGTNVTPYGGQTVNLGTSSAKFNDIYGVNIYAGDIHLSNEGDSNDVDGSWGDWTMQEGESDLFLKNNRSGKKYKFNLTEVS